MATVDLREFKNEQFVLHFGGRPNEVNAYTFANAVIAVAEALREINKEVNPGFALEIAIDAVGTGSFRARLKTAGDSLVSMFKSSARELLIGLLIAYISEKSFGPKMQIVINDDSYIMEQGSDRIILPKAVYEARRKVKNAEEIDRQISRAFEVLEDDASVSDFGITPDIHDKRPLISIPREKFAVLAEQSLIEKQSDPALRTVNENTELIVLKLVLERSDRKWQFIWHGFRISAPIKDQAFFDKLASHEYEFGQGDILDVVLAIYQRRDELSGAYLNERYEVTKVNGRRPAPKQPAFLP